MLYSTDSLVSTDVETKQIIKLADGKRITGLIIHLPLPSLPQVRAFYGIRYASLGGSEGAQRILSGSFHSRRDKVNGTTYPQASPHRFSHSVASFFYESPQGVQSKTVLAPVCPQPMLDPQMIDHECLSTERDRLKRLKPFLNYQTEDCLTLNIYVPFPDRVNFVYEKKRPIIFFVHGGDSFEYGTGNAYDLSVLASFSGFICVTFNYRLGILGFLSLRDGQINGNFGLFDLQAAILWIRTNIDRFGGDPHHISLMGYGHGAALVHLYSLSKLAQGPGGKGIKRLILLNGSGLTPWATSGLEQEVMQQLARKLNIDELKPTEKNTENLIMNGTDQLLAGATSEHRDSLKYLEPYTTAAPGIFAVSSNKTMNKTAPTPRPTVSQQIARQLRTLSLDKILELQRNLTTHHCGTSLGPVFSRHLFPRFLINKALTSSLGYISLPSSYDKQLPITATLFTKADLLVGVVSNAGIQIYRKSQWYGSSLSKGLPECARYLFNSDGRAVSELLQYFYGRQTAREPHANTVMEDQKKEIITILTDGLYLAPAFQTLQLHETLQRMERVNEQPARRYMSIFHQPSELRDQNDFGSINKLQEPEAVDDLAYWYGAPLVSPNRLDPFGSSYSKDATGLSRRLLSFLTNFVRNGNPNDVNPLRTGNQNTSLYWPEYTENAKAYMSIAPLPINKPLSGSWNSDQRDEEQFKIIFSKHTDRLSVWSQLLPRISGLPKRVKYRSITSKPNSTTASMEQTNLCNTSAITVPVIEPWNPAPGSIQSLTYFFHLRDRQRSKADLGLHGNAATNVQSSSLSDLDTNFEADFVEDIESLDLASEQGSNFSHIQISTEGITISQPQELHVQEHQNVWHAKPISSRQEPHSSFSPSFRSALLWIIATGLTLFLLNALVFIGIYYQAQRLQCNSISQHTDQGNRSYPANKITIRNVSVMPLEPNTKSHKPSGCYPRASHREKRRLVQQCSGNDRRPGKFSVFCGSHVP
ncbi:Carboxylesterase [Paragonimus heterotremus]|uniref:Carboxylesterase n=1 Tax=Paragonimus heterotremus TaxID=100268 RepID=A0A8J4T260_9TREM|nr:Carboxylesterase [Paragonimus heterotremus]